MKKNKTAQEQKVQEQFTLINIDESTIPEAVAQKISTSLLDNIQLYHRKI